MKCTGVWWRYEGIDKNTDTGDRSEMQLQGIGDNTGTGDRSVAGIFVGYR